jgi:RNA polymerase sigma-70 factor, ECF subfamily
MSKLDPAQNRTKSPHDLQPGDLELMLSVASKDEASFGLLYNRFSIPVYNYLLRLVRNRETAEEILQDVFVALWKEAGRFRGDASVKTYIFRIAHNKAVSWLRKESVRNLFREWQPEAFEDDPDEKMIASWKRELLNTALDRLPAKHRAVVELAFVQQMSYLEISQVLGCPVGTVKSRMSQAMKKLSSGLTELHETGD